MMIDFISLMALVGGESLLFRNKRSGRWIERFPGGERRIYASDVSSELPLRSDFASKLFRLLDPNPGDYSIPVSL
jgi:hypothetical protein